MIHDSRVKYRDQQDFDVPRLAAAGVNRGKKLAIGIGGCGGGLGFLWQRRWVRKPDCFSDSNPQFSVAATCGLIQKDHPRQGTSRGTRHLFENVCTSDVDDDSASFSFGKKREFDHFGFKEKLFFPE